MGKYLQKPWSILGATMVNPAFLMVKFGTDLKRCSCLVNSRLEIPAFEMSHRLAPNDTQHITRKPSLGTARMCATSRGRLKPPYALIAPPRPAIFHRPR